MYRLRDRIDPDFTASAALLADPSRALILQALGDGHALPATELARAAQVTPQTASTHLAQLVAGRVVRVSAQGRHRYYSLNPDAAELLESLSAFASSRSIRRHPTTPAEQSLRFARTCYGHLAGRIGTQVAATFLSRGYLREYEDHYELTEPGAAWYRSIGIDPSRGLRRPLCRRCIDWSERRPHLGGSLGVAMLNRFLELRWLRPMRLARCLRLTERGREELRARLGIAARF